MFSNTFYFGYPDATSGKDCFLVACLEKTSSSSPEKLVLYSACKYMWFTWAQLANQMLIRMNPCMPKDFVQRLVSILKSPVGNGEIPG